MQTTGMFRRTRGMRVGILAGAALAAGALAGVLGDTAAASEPRPLTDAELDAVAAGAVTVSESEEGIAFSAVKDTAAGRSVRADGNLRIVEVPFGVTVGTLTLSDGAQQNLQSLININAVNSAVNVLLNLNVTIDSSVGSINQLNLTEALPATPVPSAGR